MRSVLLAIVLSVTSAAAGQDAPPPPLARIALGSCANHRVLQPIWDTIAAAEPDLFLFLGDIVYADSTDPADIADAYDTLDHLTAFRRFRENVPILATWDDHDYGLNDGGAGHPRRAESQRAFLDFLREPADSPRRRQRGVYAAHAFGAPGKRTQIILLDTRYHRSPLARADALGRTLYIPTADPDATILGPEQWAWLEAQLREPAELRLVCSSIQVLPDTHPGEKWANFPRERARLLDLLARIDGVLLLTGDQHLGEISVLRRDDERPLVELTASGLTHTRKLPAPNPHRVSPLVLEENFGLIEIGWASPDPELRLQIRTSRGHVAAERVLRLSDLGVAGR